MSRIKHFIKNAFVGGVLVLLPIAILAAVGNWAFLLVTDLIQPLTDFVIKSNGLPELAGDILVILIIALSCFIVGTIVSTGTGRWLHRHFDKYLASAAPGYRLIKEIVAQFFGDKNDSPFSKGEVAKVQLFGGDVQTAVTALVTARHANGSFTVFVPTGPNPTSGNIYHLPANQVQTFPDVKVDEMMRTIIACGAGSHQLFQS